MRETFSSTAPQQTKKWDILKQPKFSPVKKIDDCFQKVKKLKKVLLAVNYNFPHYESATFIRNFYAPIFGEIMFCGDHSKPHIKLHQAPLNSNNKGYQGYMCMQLAMQLHPNFDGYFYTNDDVILNWWQVINFDFRKIWLPAPILPYEKKNHHIFGETHNTGWHWWRSVNAAKLCEEAFNDTIKFSSTAKGKALGMDRFIKNYYSISKGLKVCFVTFSDAFYLPSQFRDAYIAISEIWGHKRVFLETAVPTMLSFFMNITANNYEQLNGEAYNNRIGYGNEYLDGRAFYRFYNFNMTLIHPIKFGNSLMAKANINFFNNVVRAYSNLFYENCKSKQYRYRTQCE